MLKVKIVAVGKIKEKYLKDGIAEYVKRMKSFCKIEIISVAETKFIGNPKSLEIQNIVNTEFKRIKNYLKKDDFIIATKIQGTEYDSVTLAQTIAKIELQYSSIVFVIGGSYGLPSDFSANLSISFGKLTMPHQLFRLVLCEQIYRILMINNHRQYQK